MRLRASFLSKFGIEYIIASLMFLAVPPYFVWNFPTVALYILLVVLMCYFIKTRIISRENIGLFAALTVLYFFFSIYSGSNINGVVASLIVCFPLLLSREDLYKVLKAFTNIYAVLIIPSIIVYVLVVILGISLPYVTIEALNPIKEYTYSRYPFLLISNEYDIISFRFEGYFDEPGVVGTISGILLLIQGIKLKKWTTFPLIISGALSMSLAFFILIIIDILLFESAKLKLVMIAILACAGISLMSNEIVQTLVFDRFVIRNGEIAGINRTTSSMDKFMSEFLSSDKLLFGYGNNYAQQVVNIGGASYKDLIVNFGIVGFGLFVSIAFLCALKHVKTIRLFAIYALVFVGIIYQRPSIFNFTFFGLLFFSIFAIPRERHLKI